MAKRVRTFIALELTGSIKNRAVRMQGMLASAVTDTKWVEPENLHITLKFLGEVPEQEIYHVCRIAQDVAQHHEPFELVVQGVGAFPHARRPRVLWAGVEQGAEPLRRLQAELEEAYARAGWNPEGRRFQPHVTLGRVRRPRTTEGLEAFFQQHANWKAGQMEVDELVIMSSELTRRGPLYAVLARAPLGGIVHGAGDPLDDWVSLAKEPPPDEGEAV